MSITYYYEISNIFVCYVSDLVVRGAGSKGNSGLIWEQKKDNFLLARKLSL